MNLRKKIALWSTGGVHWNELTRGNRRWEREHQIDEEEEMSNLSPGVPMPVVHELNATFVFHVPVALHMWLYRTVAAICMYQTKTWS
jgi:hypothetical protein